MVSRDHLLFVHPRDCHHNAQPESSRPVVASSVKIGDHLFVASPTQPTIRGSVVGIDMVMRQEMWTVLVKEHRLLVDSTLVSSHVINQEWGIADNAIMLFLYEHVSSSFVTSDFNKWFCKKWDAVFEPLAAFVRDLYAT